jgi:hypothetical protein
VVGQLSLGDEDFRKGLAKRERRESQSPEIPWAQRRPGRSDLATVVAAVASGSEPTAAAIRHGRGGAARTLVAFLGSREGALQGRAIAEAVAVDLVRVSRLTAEGEARLETNPGVRAQVSPALELLAEKAKV